VQLRSCPAIFNPGVDAIDDPRSGNFEGTTASQMRPDPRLFQAVQSNSLHSRICGLSVFARMVPLNVVTNYWAAQCVSLGAICTATLIRT